MEEVLYTFTLSKRELNKNVRYVLKLHLKMNGGSRKQYYIIEKKITYYDSSQNTLEWF